MFRFPQQGLYEKKILILRRIENIIINVHMSSCKAPVILVRFQSNLKYLDRFSKNTLTKFHENSSVGAELFHVDRQTNGQKEDRQTWGSK